MDVYLQLRSPARDTLVKYQLHVYSMHTVIHGHDITREEQPRNDRNGLGLRRG
jgi:hypothetical protein